MIRRRPIQQYHCSLCAGVFPQRERLWYHGQRAWPACSSPPRAPLNYLGKSRSASRGEGNDEWLLWWQANESSGARNVARLWEDLGETLRNGEIDKTEFEDASDHFRTTGSAMIRPIAATVITFGTSARQKRLSSAAKAAVARLIGADGTQKSTLRNAGHNTSVK